MANREPLRIMSRQSTLSGETLVIVRRQWNDSENKARVRLADLRNIHTRANGGSNPASGIFRAVVPKPSLHALVLCDKFVDGAIGHTCERGTPPHEILVCVTQADNGKVLLDRLKLLSNR